MGLVQLLSALATPEQVAAWSFSHARDHDEIDAALLAQLGVQSPPVQLDPLPTGEALYGFLLRHQEKHTAMNAALGLTGSDLTAFDLRRRDQLEAFAGLNLSEHIDARQALSLP